MVSFAKYCYPGRTYVRNESVLEAGFPAREISFVIQGGLQVLPLRDMQGARGAWGARGARGPRGARGRRSAPQTTSQPGQREQTGMLIDLGPGDIFGAEGPLLNCSTPYLVNNVADDTVTITLSAAMLSTLKCDAPELFEIVLPRLIDVVARFSRTMLTLTMRDAKDALIPTRQKVLESLDVAARVSSLMKGDT